QGRHVLAPQPDSHLFEEIWLEGHKAHKGTAPSKLHGGLGPKTACRARDKYTPTNQTRLHWCLPPDHGCGTLTGASVEVFEYLRDESVMVLEDAAVASVRIDDQRGVGDAVGEFECPPSGN